MRVRAPSRLRACGFSLVEMLLVVTIVTMLLVLSTFGLRNPWRSQQVAAAAASFVQAMQQAQSLAVRGNMPVQVRIYKTTDPALGTDKPRFRAFQITGVSAGVTTDKDKFGQIEELQKFEGTVVVCESATFSSLMRTEKVLGAGSSPSSSGGESYSYLMLEFRPDGSTNLELAPAQPWTLTLVSEIHADSLDELPKDARTVVITPENGAALVY